MENLKEMKLLGYYSFGSKDKNVNYYVLQFLNYVLSDSVNKAVLTNVFTDKNTYERVVNDFGIGSSLKVSCNINVETNKVYYKVVL